MTQPEGPREVFPVVRFAGRRPLGFKSEVVKDFRPLVIPSAEVTPLPVAHTSAAHDPKEISSATASVTPSESGSSASGSMNAQTEINPTPINPTPIDQTSPPVPGVESVIAERERLASPRQPLAPGKPTPPADSTGASS